MSYMKTNDFQKDFQRDLLNKTREADELIQALLEDKIFQFFFSKTYQFKDYTDFLTFPESEKTKFLIRLYFYSNIRVGKKSRDKDKSGINLDNSGFQLDVTNANFNVNNTNIHTNANLFNNTNSPLNVNNSIKLENNKNTFKDNSRQNKSKNFFDINIKSDDEFLEKINKLNDDNAKKNILKKMYQYKIDLDNDNNEEDQKLKTSSIIKTKENDVRSKLDEILNKYRAPPKIEVVEEKNNEVESILNNIESMIIKNNTNKPNELENYINKDENAIENNFTPLNRDNSANININNNVNISKLNVSHIKKNSIYNNENNLNISENPIQNKNQFEALQLFEEIENQNYIPYNPYLHLIIEIDVMENIQFEVNKKNKFSCNSDYSGSFFVPDNYEIFVYDPFVNFNFNSNLSSLYKVNNQKTRMDYYKYMQYNKKNNALSNITQYINNDNLNNVIVERLNSSNMDNNLKNIQKNDTKTDNDLNYYINENGEVDQQINTNFGNFGNINNNSGQDQIPLISFSSKRNEINPENYMQHNKFEIFNNREGSSSQKKIPRSGSTNLNDFSDQKNSNNNYDSNFNSVTLKTKGKGQLVNNFSSGYPTNSAIKTRKKKSVVNLKRNNSFKEYIKFYKTNKNNPNILKQKNSFIKTKKKNTSNNLVFVENINIINETLSQHTEKYFFNNKFKCFLGKDLIDKIYFCPDDNIIILNFEEANKIGVIMLELLRTEAELADYEFLFKHISIKYNEELENIRMERENMEQEIAVIQERERIFKNELKVYWDIIMNKINNSYSELNDLYKENKKFYAVDNLDNFNHEQDKSSEKESQIMDDFHKKYMNNNDHGFIDSLDYNLGNRIDSIRSKDYNFNDKIKLNEKNTFNQKTNFNEEFNLPIINKSTKPFQYSNNNI